MNGPDHYRAAERLLVQSVDEAAAGRRGNAATAQGQAAAHAALAQTAATADLAAVLRAGLDVTPSHAQGQHWATVTRPTPMTTDADDQPEPLVKGE